MVKIWKKMVCLFAVMALAITPALAFANPGVQLSKDAANSSGVKVTATDQTGRKAVSVNLKITDSSGAPVKDVAFNFAGNAQKNAVYQASNVADNGTMTIAVANGHNDLNGLPANGNYELGTLSIPADKEVHVEATDAQDSDALVQLRSAAKDALSSIVVNEGAGAPNKPVNPGNNNTVNPGNNNTVNPGNNNTTNPGNNNTVNPGNNNTTKPGNNTVNPGNNNTTNPGNNNGGGTANNGGGTTNNGGGGGTTASKDLGNGQAIPSTDKLTYDYTGNAVTPEPQVTYNGIKLTPNVDYTWYYKDEAGSTVTAPSQPGMYTIVITGKGKYSGTTTSIFFIEGPADPSKIDFSKAEISGLKSSYTYTGSPIKLDTPIIKLDGKTLKEGTDYTVTYHRATDNSVIPQGEIKELGRYIMVATPVDKATYDKEAKMGFSVENPGIQNDAGQGTSNKDTSGDPKLAQTGDTMQIVVGACLSLAAIAAAVLGILMFIRSRKKKNADE